MQTPAQQQADWAAKLFGPITPPAVVEAHGLDATIAAEADAHAAELDAEVAAFVADRITVLLAQRKHAASELGGHKVDAETVRDAIRDIEFYNRELRRLGYTGAAR